MRLLMMTLYICVLCHATIKNPTSLSARNVQVNIPKNVEKVRNRMSHQPGKVIVNNKIVAHFEYDGTSDVNLPQLYSSQEELSANWRQDQNWSLAQNCKHEPTAAIIFNSYADGAWHPGRVCLE